MFKSCIYFLLFTLFLAPFVYAVPHDGHDSNSNLDSNPIFDMAPLAVSCTEDSATLTNTIDLDSHLFSPDCVKISLSENPVITCTTFDLVRHDVVVLKEGVDFGDRDVGQDLLNEQRGRLPESWSYNFETGEFVNIRRESDVSSLNTGEGKYNIWCRYHVAFGMAMVLFVMP